MALRSALVTGGAGFIGSHLVRALLAEGARVRVLDSFVTGSPANLADLGPGVETICDDIRDPAACRAACADMDWVFHLAAFISVPASVDDPAEADSVNIGGTLNVLAAARSAAAKRLVFSSSAAVYGEPDIVPTPEDALPCPSSPYGLEKLYGEHMCRLFSELYGVETVALRYFNVYGPRQSPESEYAAVVPKFMSAMLDGTAPAIYGDGEQTRDFLFVADVARANLMAAASADAVGTVLNVASGTVVSVNELYDTIARVCRFTIPPERKPARQGDVRRSGADVRLASRLIGFAPEVPLAEGLARTVNWLRAGVL